MQWIISGSDHICQPTCICAHRVCLSSCYCVFCLCSCKDPPYTCKVDLILSNLFQVILSAVLLTLSCIPLSWLPFTVGIFPPAYKQAIILSPLTTITAPPQTSLEPTSFLFALLCKNLKEFLYFLNSTTLLPVSLGPTSSMFFPLLFHLQMPLWKVPMTSMLPCWFFNSQFLYYLSYSRKSIWHDWSFLIFHLILKFPTFLFLKSYWPVFFLLIPPHICLLNFGMPLDSEFGHLCSHFHVNLIQFWGLNNICALITPKFSFLE